MATILVVDDEPGIRLALRYVLEQNDFEVIEAIDGGEGIDQFRKNKPDVVVLSSKGEVQKQRVAVLAQNRTLVHFA